MGFPVQSAARRPYTPPTLKTSLRGTVGFAAAAQLFAPQAPVGDLDEPRAVTVGDDLDTAQYDAGADAIDDTGAGLPATVLNPGGLLGEVIRHIDATSTVGNRVLALTGAVALAAHLTSRKIRTESGLSPSLLIGNLAPSGAGKENPQRVITEILSTTGADRQLVRGNSTAQGLEDAMFHRSPSLLWILDEGQHLLRGLDDRSGFSPEPIIKELSNGRRVFHRRTTVGTSRRGVDDAPERVYYPALTLLASAITNQFYRALRPEMLTGGLFARLLLIDAGEGRRRGLIPWCPLPDDLVAMVRAWHAVLGPETPAGFDPGSRGLPRVVPFSRPAKDLLEDASGEADSARIAANRAGRDAEASLWNRHAEKIQRLALIHAASRGGPDVCEVGIPAVAWARTFVDHVTHRMVSLANRYSAGDALEQTTQEVLDFIRKTERATRQPVKRSLIGAHLRLSKRDLDAALDTLLDRESIEAEAGESTSKGGRRPTFYKVAA